jgi:hypothetical protein
MRSDSPSPEWYVPPDLLDDDEPETDDDSDDPAATAAGPHPRTLAGCDQ